MTAALTTRIQSLRRGWKKQLFDKPRSTPWKKIFDRPTVINLSHLGDDADKAFTMALLFEFLYEYRQAQFELTTANKSLGNCLRHYSCDSHSLTICQCPKLSDRCYNNFLTSLAVKLIARLEMGLPR